MKDHVIKWIDLRNRQVSLGTVFLEEEDAKGYAKQLDKEYPNYDHEAVKVRVPHVATVTSS